MSDAGLRPGMAMVLDMDGVIVDSNPLHVKAWISYNRRLGIDTPEDLMERMYGRRNDEIVRDFFGPRLGARGSGATVGVVDHGLQSRAIRRHLRRHRVYNRRRRLRRLVERHV